MYLKVITSAIGNLVPVGNKFEVLLSGLLYKKIKLIYYML
jgi:hypothetical protein